MGPDLLSNREIYRHKLSTPQENEVLLVYLHKSFLEDSLNRETLNLDML